MIYVNELPSVKQHREIVLYVDDTQSFVFRLRKTLERLEIVSFIEVNSQVYFSKINLATNQSNSNMINFSLRQQEHAYWSAVSVKKFLLEETESTMFLRMYECKKAINAFLGVIMLTAFVQR